MKESARVLFTFIFYAWISAFSVSFSFSRTHFSYAVEVEKAYLTNCHRMHKHNENVARTSVPGGGGGDTNSNSRPSNTLAGYKKYGYTHEIHMITCVYLKLSMRQKCKTTSKQYINVAYYKARSTGAGGNNNQNKTNKHNYNPPNDDGVAVVGGVIRKSKMKSKRRGKKRKKKTRKNDSAPNNFNDNTEIGSTKRGKNITVMQFVDLYFIFIYYYFFVYVHA